MKTPKHERDENGICWKTRTVKGVRAWILCGRSSYEAVIRCDEHSPLTARRPGRSKLVYDKAARTIVAVTPEDE